MREKSILGSIPCENRFIPKVTRSDVAGALAVAEQAALDPVGPGHHGQFCRRDRRAAVVVRVQRDCDVLPVTHMPAEPLDLIGVDVRRRHLDGRRQVQDDLAAGPIGCQTSMTALQTSTANSISVPVKISGRVLVAELDVAQILLGVLHHQLGAAGRDARCISALSDLEHHAAEQRRGGVVHVDGRVLAPDHGLRRALDQVLTGLGQHRDGDIVGDLVLLDELADEVEVGLAGGGEIRSRSPCSPSPPADRTSCACGPASSGRSAPGCRHEGRSTAIVAPW